MSSVGSPCDETPVSTLKKRKTIEPRSWVWSSKYATKINSSTAVCNLCCPPASINIYNSSTNEVIKHLLIKHKISENSSISQISRPLKRFCMDLEEIDDQVGKVDNKEYTAIQSKVDKINEKVVRLIITKNLSFNLVDSPEFQELIDEIRNGYYKLPFRQTLRYTLLPSIVIFLLY